MVKIVGPLIEQEKRVIEKEKLVAEKLAQTRQGVFSRFPLPFTLLGTFGLVATFYGFEHIIDNIPLLSENPIILLILGVTTLAFTGTLYKKLG